MARGLCRCFRDYGVPLKVSWGVGPRRVWQSVEEMLAADIPAVLWFSNIAYIRSR